MQNDVGSVYLVSIFMASYWTAVFDIFLQVTAIASYWPDDFADGRQRRGKLTNTTPLTLSEALAARQSFLSLFN
jgi:hypothetical protein